MLKPISRISLRIPRKIIYLIGYLLELTNPPQSTTFLDYIKGMHLVNSNSICNTVDYFTN